MSEQFEVRKQFRVNSDPRTKTFQSGKVLHDFLSSVYAGKDQSGQAQYATISIKMWNMEPPQKGSQIIVTGRLGAETWVKDGNKVERIVVTADKWEHVIGNNTPQQSAPVPQQQENPDDLPF